MTTSDYLTQLQQDREDLVDNLEAKGITGLSGDETFTELVPEVLNIPSGSGGLDWSALGYNGTPESLQDEYDYSLQILNNWTSSSSIQNLFSNDRNLIYMPLVEMNPNATYGFGMFNSCANLKEIAELDFSHVQTFQNMFSSCNNLKKVPLIDLSSAINIAGIFAFVNSLIKLEGFKDLGKAYSTSSSENYSLYELDLHLSTKLTHDSLMNVINNLYDIKTKGCNNQSLVLGSTNLAKLSAEEIAIATNKGWNVS